MSLLIFRVDTFHEIQAKYNGTLVTEVERIGSIHERFRSLELHPRFAFVIAAICVAERTASSGFRRLTDISQLPERFASVQNSLSLSTTFSLSLSSLLPSLPLFRPPDVYLSGLQRERERQREWEGERASNVLVGDAVYTLWQTVVREACGKAFALMCSTSLSVG